MRSNPKTLSTLLLTCALLLSPFASVWGEGDPAGETPYRVPTPAFHIVSDAPPDLPTPEPTPEPTPIPTALLGEETPTPDSPSSSRRKASRPVTLAFVGDILMGGSAKRKLLNEGPDSFFVNVRDALAQADLCVGNLEGPLGESGKVYVKKTYTFLTPSIAAQGLRNAGFRVLTLANNHMLDFGPEALRSTLATLDDLRLQHTGAGEDDLAARRPAVVEVAGRRVAVLAYSLTYPSEFWARPGRPGCAQGSWENIRADVSSARQEGADLVVVCIHWGAESKTTLRGYQPSVAKMALEAGADAVIGHHPHIWQGLGVIGGKPVAYSLGNFVFGTYSAKVTRSGILYLTFDEENKWSGGYVLPLNVHNAVVQFSPRPLGGVEGKKFADHLTGLSKKEGASLRWDGSLLRWDP